MLSFRKELVAGSSTYSQSNLDKENERQKCFASSSSDPALQTWLRAQAKVSRLQGWEWGWETDYMPALPFWGLNHLKSSRETTARFLDSEGGFLVLQSARSFNLVGHTWRDPFAWTSSLNLNHGSRALQARVMVKPE